MTEATELGKAFANWLLENCEDFFHEEISEELCEKILQPGGFVERHTITAEDLASEGDTAWFDCDEGDAVWVYTDKLKEAADIQ